MYVFKIEKEPTIRILYYTGNPASVWSTNKGNAEYLNRNQAKAIARIANAHFGGKEKHEEERREMWYDKL